MHDHYGAAPGPHDGHGMPAVHDRHAGHSVAMFRDKFWIAENTGSAGKRFYEKVVKVKADVAAILNFFLPISQI